MRLVTSSANPISHAIWILNMCTSLLYFDQQAAPYAGRTLELPLDMPYIVVYQPKGSEFSSQANKHKALTFSAKFGFLSVSIPNESIADLKTVEGINSQGLTFSMLAFSTTKGPEDTLDNNTAVLAAIDLGNWVLSQFESVEEVKSALANQPVLTTAVAQMGGAETPFHYAVHDATGASIVIEYAHGKQQVYDNPLGVMTNGPDFPWHLTNLNNYTFLSNIDQSTLTLRGQSFQQPDSGIATAALPASNTAVGRFVRAVYYAHFSEKAKDAASAMTTLSRIMNNFDRPRGITIDSQKGSQGFDAMAPAVNGVAGYCSEYTTWTSLTDLRQGRIYLRTYDQLNYVQFDLQTLLKSNQRMLLPLAKFQADSLDGTTLLQQTV